MCVTVNFWHKIRHKVTKEFLSCVVWLATSFFILAFANSLTSDQNTFKPLKVSAMGGRLQLFFHCSFIVPVKVTPCESDHEGQPEFAMDFTALNLF